LKRRSSTVALLAVAGMCSLAWRTPPGHTDGSPAVLEPGDNSRCLLCHMNFQAEELVAQHLVQGITCADCHGASSEHRNDETSRTKPDILFGRAEVAPSCLACHEEHKYPDRVAAFLEKWVGKTRPNGRLILRQAMCTDCHGIHVIMAVPVMGDGATATP